MGCRIGFPPLLLGALMLLLAGCGKQPVSTTAEAPDVKIDASSNSAKAAQDEAKRNANLLKKITADLKDNRPSRARDRVRAIDRFKEYEPSIVIPILLEALQEKGVTEDTGIGEPNSTREAAVLALLRIVPDGEKALLDDGLKTLIKGTADSEAELREHSALAIGILEKEKKLKGDKDKAAIAALVKLCADQDKKARQAAYDVLHMADIQRTFNDKAAKMEIVQLMKSKDAGVARSAAMAVDWLKPSPEEAIPIMIEILKAPRKPEWIDTQNVVINLLRNESGRRLEPAVPALVSILKATTLEEAQKYIRPTPKPQQQSPLDGLDTDAMKLLTKIGTPAVGPVAEALQTDKWFVRVEAALVLERMGAEAKEAVPALQKALVQEFVPRDVKSKDVQSSFVVEATAMGVLKLGGDIKEPLARLTMLLKFPFPNDRALAARVLGQFGRKAKGSIPDLIPLLNDMDPVVRVCAIHSLGVMGPSAKTAIPEIVKKLSDDKEKPEVRREALAALKLLGPAAAVATPALAKLLEDKDDGIRSDVIDTLAAIGPGAKAAAPDLGKLLKRASDRERRHLMEALGAIGTEAKAAASDVVPLLTDQESETRLAAINALGLMGSASPDVVKGLADRLNKEALLHNLSVLQALARLGPGAKSAGDAIKAYGKSKDPRIAIWCAAALYKIGIDSDANRDIVLAALKDKSREARVARASAIDASDLFTGAAAKQVVPELIDALADDSKISNNDATPMRKRAVISLRGMGSLAGPAVPKLMELLDDSDEDLFPYVLEALGHIGRDAKAAAPKLNEIVEMEPKFAVAAQKALDRIEGE